MGDSTAECPEGIFLHWPRSAWGLAYALVFGWGTEAGDLGRSLAGAPLFRGVEPKVIASFAPHARVDRLRLDERLWRQDERAEHFYVVLSGVLELRRRAPSGEATLLALFGPRESPAVPVALEQCAFVADSLAATRETEVLRVRARPILDAMPNVPSLGLAMNRALLAHCRLIHAKIDVLAAGTVPQRLAAFFLDLLDRFGDERLDGAHQLPVALSRGRIAAYIGARVETVIRCCSAWQKCGLLETERDGFVIGDLDVLRAVMRGEGAERSPEPERASMSS